MTIRPGQRDRMKYAADRSFADSEKAVRRISDSVIRRTGLFRRIGEDGNSAD
jgi:hypothetical protein